MWKLLSFQNVQQGIPVKALKMVFYSSSVQGEHTALDNIQQRLDGASQAATRMKKVLLFAKSVLLDSSARKKLPTTLCHALQDVCAIERASTLLEELVPKVRCVSEAQERLAVESRF